jgi:hypothetical protein
MKSIQCMAPKGSPLVALAQQGVEAANYIIAERSVDNTRREPSVGNRSNDRVRRARSEAGSLTSGNCRLADNDVWRWITQNHELRESGHDRDDLRNIIKDQRRLRARSPTPPRQSLTRDIIPSGRGDFRALTALLRQVRWPEKFKAGRQI